MVHLRPRRRRTNAHRHERCAGPAPVFGLAWLVLILGALIYEGVARPHAGRLHRR